MAVELGGGGSVFVVLARSRLQLVERRLAFGVEYDFDVPFGRRFKAPSALPTFSIDFRMFAIVTVRRPPHPMANFFAMGWDASQRATRLVAGDSEPIFFITSACLLRGRGNSLRRRSTAGLSIERVARAIGYEDLASSRRVFKKVTGSLHATTAARFGRVGADRLGPRGRSPAAN